MTTEERLSDLGVVNKILVESDREPFLNYRLHQAGINLCEDHFLSWKSWILPENKELEKAQALLRDDGFKPIVHNIPVWKLEEKRKACCDICIYRKYTGEQ